MAEDGKIMKHLGKSKGNNSFLIDDTLMKLHMQNHTMIIYYQYKFHEILSIGYIVNVEDRKIIEI